ncbi:MAG TPA: GGDEF domain-containing protein [Burkholderiales bacterium]|nr:GGDEF domain-containing protein [Burkholderiales bacterium]
MLASLGMSIDDLEKITALTNNISCSLKNYIAARTAIRDYVISVDQKYYVQVEERIKRANDDLVQAESIATDDKDREIIAQLRESVLAWSEIAHQVRDAFSVYQETVQKKLFPAFSVLSQEGNSLIHTNAALTTDIVLDAQAANCSISGYLLNGDDQLVEKAQTTIGSAKAGIDLAMQADERLHPALQAFSIKLDKYVENLDAVVSKRKDAYLCFHDNLAPLGNRTQAAIEQFREEIIDRQRKTEELKKAYLALEEVSLKDPLTGLWNRRFLNQHLDSDVAMTLRHYDNWLREPNSSAPIGNDLVFLLVDMDHFKQVNDQYGHAAGDKVIIEIRRRLQEVFRDSDYLVRWGGEEFLVVARGVNRADAEIMAERVCAAVRSRPFDIGDGILLPKTCSIGFACFPFLQKQPRLLSWAQAVELADQALYIAKRSGRDGWAGLCSTERTHAEEVLRRLAQATADAVRDGELELKTSSSLKETIQIHSSSRAE